ncbi:MAG: MBL fold metallo-hydrolase [Chloroflexi bacterium]|nr:MBL fold metallo-hydrolase [Chloroflexota bacterium]
MAKLIILGTSNAIPDEEHENTHMVLVGNERTVLIDCVSNPTLRLKKAGVDFNGLTDLILTHFHPDHVSGVPLLLMNMWLMGRRHPLNIYGLHYTLDRIEDLMGFYSWSEWPDFFPVVFYRLPEGSKTAVLECDEFSISSSSVCHMIPAIGLRMEFKSSGRSLAYSCDTEACHGVEQMAAGVDILIHEASGGSHGHSSAAQAGKTAQAAGAGSLYLIHYPTGIYTKPGLVEEARQHFSGPVALAQDFMTFDLG